MHQQTVRFMAIAVLSQSPVMEAESQNQSYERISWGIDYQLMRFLFCLSGRTTDRSKQGDSPDYEYLSAECYGDLYVW